MCFCLGIFIFFFKMSREIQMRNFRAALNKKPHMFSPKYSWLLEGLYRDLLSYECFGSMIKPVNENNRNEST